MSSKLLSIIDLIISLITVLLNFELSHYCSGKRRPSDTHGVVESVPDVTNERSNGTSTFENSGSSRVSPIAGKSS